MSLLLRDQNSYQMMNGSTMHSSINKKNPDFTECYRIISSQGPMTSLECKHCKYNSYCPQRNFPNCDEVFRMMAGLLQEISALERRLDMIEGQTGLFD